MSKIWLTEWVVDELDIKQVFNLKSRKEKDRLKRVKYAVNISNSMFISFWLFIMKVTIKINIVCPRLRS